MIAPEQGKKPSGKAGKKKNKAKKAKRSAVELEVVTAADSVAEPVVASTSMVDVGPQLLAWIDRVQDQIDHLLTLVDPAPAPEGLAPPTAPEDAPVGDAAAPPALDGTADAPAADETPEGLAPPVADDDDVFEPGDAPLTAILVARELLARGESASDVRRRLRDGYGVTDPEAVLARVA